MKISICVQPDYSPKTNGKKVIDRIVLNQDWYFIIDKVKFWIPAGYDCDGASIPRPLWSLIGSPFDPHFVAPAYAHDIIYLFHCFTRAQGDEIFYQLLRCNYENATKSKAMWGVLRMFAGFAWKNDDKDKSDIKSLRAEIALRPDKEKFNFLV